MDPEIVELEVMTLWRAMFKLQKFFHDLPQPAKIAENVSNSLHLFIYAVKKTLKFNVNDHFISFSEIHFLVL